MQGLAAGWTFRQHQFERGVAARTFVVNLFTFHDFSLRALLVLRILILRNKVKKMEASPSISMNLCKGTLDLLISIRF